jgi:hypothetical protein
MLLDRPVSRAEAEAAVLRRFAEVFAVTVEAGTAANEWLANAGRDLAQPVLSPLP